ncbi:1-acyl-sn-glycerol-3-phosphate acyltransferase alpha-like isoform X2 [Hemicordylus capensis]|uniref:1-acyl-sn-glycerol-3-phosphate acyltransferase alpha-like isoform X2 n=1 Tax=Hemicordylus capensis TaxID=884348 RepID=UPI002302D006|nr:1-acyl-sn-glycerol-3-phosphate acyltransferase alpha-like isoform X2 [Hemicordylus capensis]
MELFQWILMFLIILLTGASLLYQHSTTFNFFCKMALFYVWITLVTAILSPIVAAFYGQRVENMKILRFTIQPLKHFFGIKIVVQGSKNLNIKEPYVMVANHQSHIDLLGMAEIIPDCCVPVVKKEILYLGSVGWACWLCKMIFIDRGKPCEAMDTLMQVAQTIRHQNMRVWVFPEGTRNQNKTMLPFKQGSFRLAVEAQIPNYEWTLQPFFPLSEVWQQEWEGTRPSKDGRGGGEETEHRTEEILQQVPIIPVVISSYQDTYDFKGKRFTPGIWTIRILPKIETQGLGPENIPALIDSTQQMMQETFWEISGEA